MVKPRLCSALVLSGLLAVLTACQDAPTVTAPARAPAAGIVQSSRGLHRGEVPFYCTLRRYAPSTPVGWQSRQDTLFFPRGDVDEAGRTVRYEYRGSFPDGRPLNSASCLVPYTEGALRRLDRFFEISEGGGADQYRARQGMVTAQDCEWSGSTCVFDPVVVAPPPSGPPCPACDAPFPGHTGGGWGGLGGGGGGETPPDPQDTPSDTTCKTSDPVVNSEAVQTAFEELWKNSNYEVNGVVQPQSERRERGGFIISTATGYTFQPFPSEWASDACTIDVPPGYLPPAGAIAWVHTHPYSRGEVAYACGEALPGTGVPETYNGSSSWPDNDISGAWGLPGYLIDAEDISTFTSNRNAADVSLGRCAY